MPHRMVLALLLVACDRSGSPSAGSAALPAHLVAIEPPVAQGAASPNLVATPEGALLTWIEPASAGAHRIRFATLSHGVWSKPVTIAEGTAIIANTADVPSVARQDRTTLVAHWAERRASPGAEGYDVILARSTDSGATWRRLGSPHRDGTDTEHGFVALIADGDAILALWLDGRGTAIGSRGATGLRAGRVGESIGDDQLIDDRVCDCCSTAAAMTSVGPIVAYRDRAPDELRDPWVMRRVGGTWQTAHPVHADGWRMTACPVNGPAIAAHGDDVIVAWFTAAERARVRVAFSRDAGATFEAPIDVDPPDAGRTVLGRVDVVLDSGGDALVSWIAVDRANARLAIRRVARDRRRGPELELARMTVARDVGFPRLERVDDELVLAWPDPAGRTVHVSRLRGSDVPAVVD
jgi:hypothetical protein